MADLVPASEAEVDGLQLGVLPDGTPFLSTRALATLCGVAPSAIITWGPAWSRDSNKPRDIALTGLLDAAGFTGDSLFIKVLYKGTLTHAYTDTAAWAILEYYAYDPTAAIKPEVRQRALENYRRLARAGLRLFILRACGHALEKPVIPPEWRHFIERMDLNRAPPGYFTVWMETSPVLLDALRAGLPIDAHTVPDISIGMAWAKFWKDQGYEQLYGAPIKYEHRYPPDCPQAVKDIRANAYPLNALGEFRRWLNEDYLPNKLPAYLARKKEQGVLSAKAMGLILDAIVPERSLEDRNRDEEEDPVR